MVPTPLHSPRSSRLIITLISVLSQHVPNIFRKFGSADNDPTILHTYAKRAQSTRPSVEFIVFACLIPVLVLLSGVFAGLTLGYMSLDETQLNVLSISGTPSAPSHASSLAFTAHSTPQPAEAVRCKDQTDPSEWSPFIGDTLARQHDRERNTAHYLRPRSGRRRAECHRQHRPYCYVSLTQSNRRVTFAFARPVSGLIDFC